MAQMTFVLVHGAWHDAWCFENLATHLIEDGHRVIVPELPGRNQIPAARRYSEYLAVLENLLSQQTTPLVLVGHSLAGVHISQIASAFSSNIKALVYIAGFLLNPGESVLSVLERKEASFIDPYVNFDLKKKLVHIDKLVAPDIFYHHCKPMLQQVASQRLVSESLLPMQYKLGNTTSEFANIPKYYIYTSDDHAVPITLQRDMVDNFNGHVDTLTLHSDHSPFLSYPKELGRILQKIGNGGLNR